MMSDPPGGTVDEIGRRPHEQDAQIGVATQETVDEELIPPPDVVPRLERAHDERVCARGGGRALEGDGERMGGERPPDRVEQRFPRTGHRRAPFTEWASEGG